MGINLEALRIHGRDLCVGPVRWLKDLDLVRTTNNKYRLEDSMKFILAFVFCLFAYIPAQAGGQFTIQNMVYDDFVPRPMLGLSIDQKVVEQIYFSGWAGLGSRPDKEQKDVKHWSTIKAGVDYRIPRVSFGAGVQMNASSEDWTQFYPQIQDADKEFAVYLKMAIKLW